MTGVQHTFSGQRADRFMATGADGRVRVDFAALDSFIAEAIAEAIAVEYLEQAQDLARTASQASHLAKGRAKIYAQLSQRFDQFAGDAFARAERHRHRNRRTQGLVEGSAAEAMATVAARLREASQARHQVPVSLGPAAGWFQIAAETHVDSLGCDWCRVGRCPAAEAAHALLGEEPLPAQQDDPPAQSGGLEGGAAA